MGNINYTELLNLFVNDDEMREWQNNPFRIGDKAIATDAFTMVIINADLTPDVQELTDYNHENVLSVIPETGGVLGKIDIKDIRSIIKECPKVDVTKTCDCCEGEGEVEFQHEWNDKFYEKYCDCPVCEGEGEVKAIPIQKEVDPAKKIKIGISYFSAKLVFRLGMACKITNTDHVEVLLQQGEKLATVFRINDANLLFMPVIECDNEDYLGEIKINK